MKQLWAPWRLEYVAGADEAEGCIFCRAAAAPDADGLVVQRGELAFCLLNKYPYASGHLMVAPYRHVAEFGDLTEEEALELHRLAASGMGALAQTFAPQGYNVGWNLGRIAGAGVVDHVHLHVSLAGRATRTSCRCSRTSRCYRSISTRRVRRSQRPGRPS